MSLFDQLVKKGFETLLGTSISPKWWRLAQLPSKFGGMAMRTGLKTFGAHYMTSLVKTAASTEKLLGAYDLMMILEEKRKIG